VHEPVDAGDDGGAIVRAQVDAETAKTGGELGVLALVE
jgi:hypothetical protein